ncbi:MAG: 6-phosphogluconolactonase [Sediminicola sp.]|tara:strand:+ start:9369 stop:10136 length:768 start_codon:yes stop_codon:yes gene_type:complete
MSDFQNKIHVLPTPLSTGTEAGKAIETCIVKLQREQDSIRIIFAAAPSQDTMLDYLAASTAIEWDRITAFNMDEYLDLPKGAPQLFSKYLETNLFNKVPLKRAFTIDPHSDAQTEIQRYSSLIKEGPIDIVCLGIGENGHIAFNDPPVADFEDPQTLKVVELDEECRTQQVNDLCFETLGQVPKRALTLTVPTLMNGANLFCVVVGENKSLAVKNTLMGPVSTTCPASILTTHPNCHYYFDDKAYRHVAKIEQNA